MGRTFAAFSPLLVINRAFNHGNSRSFSRGLGFTQVKLTSMDVLFLMSKKLYRANMYKLCTIREKDIQSCWCYDIESKGMNTFSHWRPLTSITPPRIYLLLQTVPFATHIAWYWRNFLSIFFNSGCHWVLDCCTAVCYLRSHGMSSTHVIGIVATQICFTKNVWNEFFTIFYFLKI